MTHTKTLQAQTDKMLRGMLRKAHHTEELQAIARTLEENATTRADWYNRHQTEPRIHPHEMLDELDHRALLDHLEEHDHPMRAFAGESHENALDAARAIHRPDLAHARKGDKVVWHPGNLHGHLYDPLHGVVEHVSEEPVPTLIARHGDVSYTDTDTGERHTDEYDNEMSRFGNEHTSHLAQWHADQQGQKSLRMRTKALPHEELHAIARTLEDNATAHAAQDHTEEHPVHPHERLDPLDHMAFLDHLEQHSHPLREEAGQSPRHALHVARTLYRPKTFREGDEFSYDTTEDLDYPPYRGAGVVTAVHSEDDPAIGDTPIEADFTIDHGGTNHRWHNGPGLFHPELHQLQHHIIHPDMLERRPQPTE